MQLILRVIAGSALGASATINTRLPISYLHFQLQPGARHRQPLASGHTAFAYLFAGEAALGSPGVRVARGQAALFSGGGTVELTLAANARAPAELLLLAGPPLKEPIVRYGPFVMNTHAEIEQAIRDWLLSMMFENHLAKFPGLRIASVENGAEFLGDMFNKLRSNAAKIPGYYPEDPVEMFRRSVWINPLWEDDVDTVVELMGAELSHAQDDQALGRAVTPPGRAQAAGLPDEQTLQGAAHAGIGQIVNMQELAPRPARPPNVDISATSNFGFMEIADQRGQDVRVLGIKIVVGSVQVRRHGRYEAAAILAAVHLARNHS